MKTIEIVVDKKGNTKVETKGFLGSSCQDASKAFEEALGARQNEQMTSEYFQTEGPHEINVNN